MGEALLPPEIMAIEGMLVLLAIGTLFAYPDLVTNPIVILMMPLAVLSPLVIEGRA